MSDLATVKAAVETMSYSDLMYLEAAVCNRTIAIRREEAERRAREQAEIREQQLKEMAGKFASLKRTKLWKQFVALYNKTYKNFRMRTETHKETYTVVFELKGKLRLPGFDDLSALLENYSRDSKRSHTNFIVNSASVKLKSVEGTDYPDVKQLLQYGLQQVWRTSCDRKNKMFTTARKEEDANFKLVGSLTTMLRKMNLSKRGIEARDVIDTINKETKSKPKSKTKKKS